MMTKELEFKVREWRECKKGQSLQGFFTLELPSGLVLHDMTFHVREDGSRWVGLPARSFTKSDGATGWFRLVDFTDRSAAARFQELAKAALEKFFESSHLPAPTAEVAVKAGR
jgi:hypothetical protein